MLTNDKASYFLKLKKKLEREDKVVIESKKTRLELIAPDDKSVKFCVEITRNDKIFLKTSIHHMETNHFIGLLRIDYKGSHKNPYAITDKVPAEMIPYAGEYITEPHVHIYVEGYKPLAWALPLEKYDFDLKTLENSHDVNLLLSKFAGKINLDLPKINTSLL